MEINLLLILRDALLTVVPLTNDYQKKQILMPSPLVGCGIHVTNKLMSIHR